MDSYKIATKAEAGKTLGVVNRDINVQASKFNGKRALPFLMCLDDAVDNLHNELQRSQLTGSNLQITPELLLDLLQFVMGFHLTIDDMTKAICQNGFWEPTTKIELPTMAFGVCIEEDLDKHLSTLYQEKKIGKKSIVFHRRHMFLNRLSGYFYIVLEQGHSKHALGTLERIMLLRDLFYKKGLLEAMIHVLPEGSEIEFGKDNLMKVTYPEGVTSESIYEGVGLSLSSMRGTTGTAEWNSYLHEIGLENLRLGAEKGNKNMAYLRKESLEIYKAYCSMPAFRDYFKRLYKVDIEQFSLVLPALMDNCYGNIHTVGVWQQDELLKKMRSIGKFNAGELVTLTNLLSSHTSEFQGLMKMGDCFLTNFRRLALSELSILDTCFNEFYDKNLKGKAFEEATRNLFRGKGLKTVSKSVEIFEPVLPADISLLLWGKRKQRTDIDAIAARKNQIVIVECKQVKGGRKHELHELHQFKKYVVELYYKTQWILSNFDKFKEYVGNTEWQNLDVQEDSRNYLFPLVVTNKAIEVKGERIFSVVTYKELKEILQCEWCIESEKEAGTVELETESRNIHLQWFSR